MPETKEQNPNTSADPQKPTFDPEDFSRRHLLRIAREARELRGAVTVPAVFSKREDL